MSGYFGLPFRAPGGRPWNGSSIPEPFSLDAQNPLVGAITYHARPEKTRVAFPTSGGGGTVDLHTYFSRIHNTDCHPCTSVGNDNLNDTEWLCNVWPEVFSDSAGANRRLPEADRDFDAAGTAINLNVCGFDYGFQSRQSGRRWHGAYGFDVVPSTAGTLCAGGRSTMKYLDVDVLLDFQMDFGTEEKTVRDSDGFVYVDVVSTYTGSDTVTASVTTDAQSGERTRSTTISTPGYIFDQGGTITTPTYGRFSIFTASVPTNFTNFGVNCGSYSLLGYTFASLADISTYIAADTTYAPWGDLVPTVTAAAITGGWKFHVEYQFVPKTTVVHFTGSFGNPSLPGSEAWTTTFTGSGTASMVFEYTLTNENPLADVDADAMTLLDEWNFSNKEHFPQWRKDGALTVAPFVGRNEAETANDPLSVVAYVGTMDDYNAGPAGGPWPQVEWKDPTCWQWVFPYGHNELDSTGNIVQIHDGSIIGQPLPLGYGMATATNTNDGIIDLKNGVWTTTDCHGTPDWLSYGSGTPIELPRHCAKWTPANVKDYIYPCSFISHEGFGQYDVFIQELVQVQIPTTSHDWMRPYGVDRELLDYTTATCAGPVLSASLRYPTKPPFGLCSVSAAVYDSGTGKTTFTFSPAATWDSDTTWSVDIFNGATNASGVVVPESTAAHAAVTLHSDNTLTGDYSAAKFFCPAGLQPWTCDTKRKGDYVTREATTAWDGTVTDAGSTQRTAIVTGECCPVVLIMDFPSPDYDFLLWRGCITQWMIDPIWRAGKYCDDAGTLMDNVICPGAGTDDTCQISLCDVPFEEARTGPPTNGGYAANETAPAVADGTDISNIGAMPSAGPTTELMPWQVYAICLDASMMSMDGGSTFSDSEHF